MLKMELNELLSVGVIVVILGIVLTFGLQTQSEVRADINQTTSPEAYAGATDSISATGKFASKQGLIVTAVVAVIIIGLLLRMFVFKQNA
jgi:uncharacterized membrane protein